MTTPYAAGCSSKQELSLVQNRKCRSPACTVLCKPVHQLLAYVELRLYRVLPRGSSAGRDCGSHFHRHQSWENWAVMLHAALVRDPAQKERLTALAGQAGLRMAASGRTVAWLMTLVSMCAVSALAIAEQAGPPITSSAVQPDAQVGAIAKEVVRDLCGRQVVLLGESPTHGFGKTMKFKAELIRELVDGCHFNAVFFETGIYDFLNIQTQIKSRGKVAGDAVAAAIGGLWANRDVEPLVPYLLDKVRGGQLVIGGIDDQINRGTWAQHQMPADLVQYLAGDEKARCLGILHRHMLWQYRDDAPYAPKDKALIVGCLDDIETSIGQGPAADVPSREAHLAMVASLKREFARDFTQDLPGVDSDTRLFNARDGSMYQNFRWLVSRSCQPEARSSSGLRPRTPPKIRAECQALRASSHSANSCGMTMGPARSLSSFPRLQAAMPGRASPFSN